MRRWIHIPTAAFTWPSGLISHVASNDYALSNGTSMTSPITGVGANVASGTDQYAPRSSPSTVAPVYHTGGQNGKPYMTYASTRVDRVGFLPATSGGNTENTIFFVMKGKTGVTGYVLDTPGDTFSPQPGYQRRYILAVGGVFNFGLGADPGGGAGSGGFNITPTNNAVQLYTFVIDGVNGSSGRINGVQVTTSSAAATPSIRAWAGPMSLGSYWGTDAAAPGHPGAPYHFDSDYYEWAIFNRKLNSTELASVETYLMTKYNL